VLTVCRELAESINETAAPQDRVTEEALRERARAKTTDKNLFGRNDQITPKPPPTPFDAFFESQLQHHPEPEPDPDPDPDYPRFDPALDIDKDGNPLKPRTWRV
jgi:hypothetical protein